MQLDAKCLGRMQLDASIRSENVRVRLQPNLGYFGGTVALLMSVGDYTVRVIVRGMTVREPIGQGSLLFLVIFCCSEEGSEDSVPILEIIVDYIDEEGCLHELLNNLARGCIGLVEVSPLAT
jgi:hypothetical protein